MAGLTGPGPMVAVRAFVEAFNNNDVELAQAAWADDAVIIDDFPPHAWAGAQVVTRWLRDMARMAAEYGMSDWSVTLEEPRHVLVSDRHAYVVVPVEVRWLQDGAPAARAGSMTLAAREGTEGWRISACAWTWSED